MIGSSPRGMGFGKAEEDAAQNNIATLPEFYF
jgi:hypothetical protein